MHVIARTTYDRPRMPLVSFAPYISSRTDPVDALRKITKSKTEFQINVFKNTLNNSSTSEYHPSVSYNCTRLCSKIAAILPNEFPFSIKFFLYKFIGHQLTFFFFFPKPQFREPVFASPSKLSADILDMTHSLNELFPLQFDIKKSPL